MKIKVQTINKEFGFLHSSEIDYRQVEENMNEFFKNKFVMHKSLSEKS